MLWFYECFSCSWSIMLQLLHEYIKWPIHAKKHHLPSPFSALILPLSFCFSLLHSHSLYTLSLTHPYTHKHSVPHCLSYTHTPIFLSLSLRLSYHTHTPLFFISYIPSFSLTFKHALSLSLPHLQSLSERVCKSYFSSFEWNWGLQILVTFWRSHLASRVKNACLYLVRNWGSCKGIEGAKLA